MSPCLSVIIICKNEEARIRRCLDSVSWADEILVVDSGSTDQTLQIVKEFTDKIIINEEWPGFGPQKKIAEDHASHDWIFSIDSDEVVSDELAEEIQSVLSTAESNQVFRVNRLTHFCGKFIRHSGWHPDRIVRLYNKKQYHFNDAPVHENIECKGAIKKDLSGLLYHFTVESLDRYIDKRNRYARIWAETQYKKGRRVNSFSLIGHALFAFIRHYFLKLGILDGYHGFLIAAIQMQYTFNKYIILRSWDSSR